MNIKGKTFRYEGSDHSLDVLSVVRLVLNTHLSPDDRCVNYITIRVVGNPNAWVYLTQGTLRFAYPKADPPTEALSAVLTPIVERASVAWSRAPA